MKTVITTVGTSLFENYLKTTNRNKDIISDLKDKSFSEKEHYPEEIISLKKDIKSFMVGNNRSSAEIKSLSKIIEIYKEQIDVYFICSDTILSYLAAEIIKENFLDKNILKIYILAISGLTVRNDSSFIKEGLSNLISELNIIYDGHSPNYIMNITGGFKGVIPFLTIWSQINNIKSVYIFEESDVLISIPQIPININFDFFEKHSSLIENLENGIEKPIEQIKREYEIFNDFPDIFYELKENGKYFTSLNPLGLILWNNYKNFDIVKIPKGSIYWGLDNTKKTLVTTAIKKLISELKKIEDFDIYKNEYIKHTKLNDNTYVYKYSKESLQIRIHYSWKDNKLIIFNCMFIQNKAEDTSYGTIFSNQYDNLKKSEFINLTFPKENKQYV